MLWVSVGAGGREPRFAGPMRGLRPTWWSALETGLPFLQKPASRTGRSGRRQQTLPAHRAMHWLSRTKTFRVTGAGCAPTFSFSTAVGKTQECPLSIPMGSISPTRFLSCEVWRTSRKLTVSPSIESSRSHDCQMASYVFWISPILMFETPSGDTKTSKPST